MDTRDSKMLLGGSEKAGIGGIVIVRKWLPKIRRLEVYRETGEKSV
jgi:hypothetical protein